jgi:Acetyltransferase (GNAT) family
MNLVEKAGDVLATIQRIKTAGGSTFATNFFPVQARLDDWVARQELLSKDAGDIALFARKDRDFFHLYYCATSDRLLADTLGCSAFLKDKPITTDLIGRENMVQSQAALFSGRAFRSYAKLIRLARLGREGGLTDPSVEYATAPDVPLILALLESCFDPYSDQLPKLYELEEAVQARQIVLLRAEGNIGALVHFETQGLTSTVRYWAVHPEHREAKFGSRVIRHYFAMHPAVKRFVLWVRADNENAVRRYAHFGYAPDGLVDCVMVNTLIKP